RRRAWQDREKRRLRERKIGRANVEIAFRRCLRPDEAVPVIDPIQVRLEDRSLVDRRFEVLRPRHLAELPRDRPPSRVTMMVDSLDELLRDRAPARHDVPMTKERPPCAEEREAIDPVVLVEAAVFARERRGDEAWAHVFELRRSAAEPFR